MEDMKWLKALPCGWQIKKMPQVVKWSSGGTPKATEKSYYDGGSIPWLIIGDLNDGIVRKASTNITELGLNNSSAKIVPVGTLLVAMYGSIGKLGITAIECCTNQAIAFAKELYGVSTKYLFYYLKFIKPNLISKGKGGTQKNISLTVLNSMFVIVPPLPEQERIVSKIEELFSQLDRGIETLEKIKQQLLLYRQAVLKNIFENEIKKYPHKVMALKDLVVKKDGLRRGPFGGSIKKAYFVPSGYKVYEQGNAINDTVLYGKYFINAEKYAEMKSFQVQPHDLLVSCSGTLGRITELPDNTPQGIINQALLRIRLNNDIITNDYFIRYFRAEFFQRKIIAQGSAMQNLVSIKEFKEITLMVPNIQCQSNLLSLISEKLSVCDNIEKTVKDSLLQSEAIQQSILKKAFEGKL